MFKKGIPLGQNLPTKLFVHNDADSMLCDVEHPTSLAMVVFERHTLLEGSIALDINNVSLLVDFQKGGQRLNTMLSEFLGEQVTCAAAITLGVDHLVICNIEPHKRELKLPASQDKQS